MFKLDGFHIGRHLILVTCNGIASMNLFRCLPIVCVLYLHVTFSTSYKILLVPLVQGSHVSCILAIARELGRRHHETHILVDEGYEVKEDTAAEMKQFNITFVQIIDNRYNSKAETKELIEKVVHRMTSDVFPYKDLLESTSHWAESHAQLLFLENEPLIEKLNSAHYDLAVIDGMYCTKHFYLLAHRLGIPWITYTDYPDPWLMRVPWSPSIVPGKFSFQSEKMSLIGRISNVWFSNIAKLDEQIVKIPENIITKYQRYGVFDSVVDLIERSKFFILTSDIIIDSPKPIMPNMIEVGGLTTQPAKKLPEDIQSFLDAAEDGVILVSFGSMMSKFPDILLNKFLDAFNRIDRHRIIWRMTNSSSKFQIPDFIKPGGWIPQNDILAHPKVKLFINHCGSNGQFEALYHGVNISLKTFFYIHINISGVKLV